MSHQSIRSLRTTLGLCPEARAMHVVRVPTRIVAEFPARDARNPLASIVRQFELSAVRSMLSPLASR